MAKYIYTQPYLIVGALVVRDSKILLIQENHIPDKGKWNIPGGKLDFGEDPFDGVKREVFEESGLYFTPTAMLAIHSVHRKDILQGDTRQVHAIRMVFLGDAEGEVNLEHGDAKEKVQEIADFKWLTPAEILALDDKIVRYRDTKRLVEKYQADINYPLATVEHFVQK